MIGRMHLKKLVVVALAWGVVGGWNDPAWAALKLPGVISDHMVVQQKEPVRVWGWASPGDAVTVKLAGGLEASSASGASVNAVADGEGRWAVELPQLNAGGPYELQVETSKGEKATVKDVLVGEVWVCSGQSNMEWSITAGVDGGEEIASGADQPRVRLLDIPNVAAEEPQDDVQAQWRVCTPDAVKTFSAVGYLFGLKLQKELGVPVGLIGSNWGGTQAEPWTSPEAMRGEPKLRHLLEEWGSNVVKNPQLKLNPARPSVLYNAMIAPITRYPIRGVIWYQGESNVQRAYEYRVVFSNLIKSWRAAWGDAQMPFYFVQIAPFKYSTNLPQWNVSEFALPELWDSQVHTLKRVDHAGMAVISDVGNLDDIHPRNKRAVAERLANLALAETYGKQNIPVSGPIYDEADVEGDKIEIKFSHAGSGLTTRDGQPPNHFEVAGEDRQFHPATAEIKGRDRVIVRSSSVEKPVAVRFGWHEAAVPNLMNKEGLPASPFRTDNWKLTTQTRE